MGTRYVWSKKSPKYVEKTRTVDIMNGVSGILGTNKNYTMGYVSTREPYPIYDENGSLQSWGTYGPDSTGNWIKELKGSSFVTATAPNFSVVYYFVPENNSTVIRYGEPLNKNIISYWYGTYSYKGDSAQGINTGAAVLVPTDESYDSSQELQFIEHYIEASGETVDSKFSSNTNSSPGDDYTYLGSDSIDPISIYYPTSGVNPGDNITVSVTPASNIYGGTIIYLYQYSLNGGGWLDAQTTTATSIQFDIPNTATSIQFRARAQDDMGFTSTDYVTGPIVNLGALNVWVGVSGKAHRATGMWVGVNGTSRKVKAAWIGVNGIARRVM